MFRTAVRYPLLLMGLMAVFFSSVASARYPSPADCAAEADRASRDSGTVMGGAVRGAARGAVFGAIVGDSKSARKGAAIGGVVSSARRANQKGEVYERVYDNCMRGYHYY